MFGASGLKLVKYLVKMETALTAVEVVSLILGMLVAFVVSLFVVRFLMNFVRRYSFAIFGYYRIILGVLVFIMALARPGMMP
jgi:undecaprenyl-diphosphatase